MYNSGSTSKVLRDTKSGRKRGLSLYMSKQRKKKKIAAVNDGKNKLNIVPNYQRITHSSSEDSIDVLNDDKEYQMTESSEEEHPESDNNYNINKDVTEETGNAIEGEEIADMNNGLEENNLNLTFKEKCLETLSNKKFQSDLIENLDKSGDLYDFMQLLELLSNGKFPTDNIVLQLLLDRVRFQTCSNTVGMRYRDVTKNFWSIVYRLCKGAGLKFFSGEKNWGQVVLKKSDKSKYAPEKAHINFAVPDEKRLRDMKKVIPKIVPPGKISKTIEMLKDKKDLILMADGKLVTKGLRANFCGDIDLFGHEENPNIDDLRNYLSKQLKYICTTVDSFEGSTSEDQFTVTLGLSDMICAMIRRVRNFCELERKKLQKFLTGNYPTKPDKAISSCKTNIYTSSNWIKKALDINNKLLKFMATLQNNLHLYAESKEICLDKCINVKLLHSAEYVSSNLEKEEYPHLIKKYSDDWNDFLRQSVIADTTIGEALGINGNKALKSHHNNFILENFTRQMFTNKYPPDYENDVIATLCTVFMSALMPSCAIFYEEGSSFIRGKHQPKLINCSPCGVIR